MNTETLEKKSAITGHKFTYQEASSEKVSESLDANGWIVKSLQPQLTQGTCIRLMNQRNEIEALINITRAEKSSFQSLTKVPESLLNQSIFIESLWVAPRAQMAEVLHAILYLALRRGRIWKRSLVVALVNVPNHSCPLATMLKLNDLEHIAHLNNDNNQFKAAAQEIKYSIYNIYKQSYGESLQFLKSCFAAEIIETHRLWLDRFFQGAWSQAIMNRTLSKGQYINGLFNLHEYVRQTTRLCARCIAFCEDIELRNHYINHLRGEINHELIAERDLKHLGADVEYLKHYHVPDLETNEFMVVQESTIGFYQDPVLMLACPLTAEGVSAHLSGDFIKALRECITSWGIQDPNNAMKFFTSHVNTDGGDDGHWNLVVQAITKYIHDEVHLQKFLRVLNAAMNGFERGFNATVENYKLWTAKT